MNITTSSLYANKTQSRYLGVIIRPNDGKELGQVLVNNNFSGKGTLNQEAVMGQMVLIDGDIRCLRSAWRRHSELLMNIANKQVAVRIAGMPSKLGESGILEISKLP